MGAIHFNNPKHSMHMTEENLQQHERNTRRSSTWATTTYKVVACEGEHKRRQIKIKLHRQLLADGNGALIKFDHIDNILIGNVSTLFTKLGKDCKHVHTCFSIVLKNKAEYDFQALHGRDRYEIVMKILALSGYRRLKTVANSLKKMKRDDTMKLLLCLKGREAESSRKSVLNVMDNEARTTSAFLQAVKHTDPDL